VHIAHPSGDSGKVLSIDDHPPGIRQDQPGDDVEQCAFSTATWTQDPDKLLINSFETDLTQGQQST
jgi:hypothetical protein